jgi:glycosyltransferase involved in cell wall biosynthesis
MLELTVVMPVYNEEEIISFVIQDWIRELRELKIDFVMKVYNDGSKDNSLNILNQEDKKYPELHVIDKPNSGHGPTILQGYREAETPWILQVDSDNEMRAEHFKLLWKNKEEFDFLIGVRESRGQFLSRKIVTAISRATVRAFFGKGVTDVNSPYRLMRREKFEDIFKSIRQYTFAPNVIISGMVARRNMRIFETNIPIKFRTTGEVSIKKWKLLKSAIKSWWQTVIYRLRNP